MTIWNKILDLARLSLMTHYGHMLEKKHLKELLSFESRVTLRGGAPWISESKPVLLES